MIDTFFWVYVIGLAFGSLFGIVAIFMSRPIGDRYSMPVWLELLRWLICVGIMFAGWWFYRGWLCLK